MTLTDLQRGFRLVEFAVLGASLPRAMFDHRRALLDAPVLGGRPNAEPGRGRARGAAQRGCQPPVDRRP